MAVDGVPLHAGSLGDRTDRRARRTDSGVETERGFHDALSRAVLTLAPTAEGVPPLEFLLQLSHVHRNIDGGVKACLGYHCTHLCS